MSQMQNKQFQNDCTQEHSFEAFYNTLDKSKFKYFVKNDGFYVYHSDITFLPQEAKPKNDKCTSTKLQSIEGVIKTLLTVKRVAVEEYTGTVVTKKGFPYDFRDFSDICIGERVPPTVFAVTQSKSGQISVSFIKDSKAFVCEFQDDDLLSNLFSLANQNNCIEILHNSAPHERIFNSWGIPNVLFKGTDSLEILKKYMKLDLPVVKFTKEDCCIVNIADFDLVDFGTVTQQGKRLLDQWLRCPCVDQVEIEKRLSLSECFSKINITVENFSDLKRLTTKIANNSITIPEAIKLCQTIDQVDNLLSSFARNNCSSLVTSSFVDPLMNLKSLFVPLSNTIKATINFSTSKVHLHLSEDLKALEIQKFEIFAEVEEEFLRVKKDYPKVSFFNKQFKVSRLEYNQTVFDSKRYLLVSMLKTGVLFVTKRLSELNEKIATIDSEIVKIETQIFTSLVREISGFVSSLESFNYLIALIDIYKAFSQKVGSDVYSRPVFSKSEYSITGMFHPLLEHKDCVLNDMAFTKDICVLTGPNMGGKSTIIKTLSMVSLYAQIGCYVPAKSAVLPIFDRIFLRVGAKDCSCQRLSTFMVEMTELNRILRTATPNSLILIDELGRGTSAIDGLSLALAVKETLHRLGAKTVMATHFSELGDESTMNKKMSVDKGVLTYKIEDGICDLSFGITVAVMAHFPESVIAECKRNVLS